MGQDAVIENASQSPYLAAVGAVWSDGPGRGRWIAGRLAQFGPSVGHAVPLDYAGYAVLPLWPDEALPDDKGPSRVAALLDALAPFTGSQPVTCGMWEGFGWFYGPDEDPARGVFVAWTGTERPAQVDIDRARSEGRELVARLAVARPDVAPLELPDRRYYLWTGPLAAALAFEHQAAPPSLIWPEDRSWCFGAPIYTNEIAIAGTQAVIDAVLADPLLNARRVTVDDVLDIDD